jgi:hypothetical protein
LLATWQYGLGRSAAWTSDLKGQWAQEWLSWQDFPRFAAQLVGWVLPAPQVEGLTAETALKDGQAIIRLTAMDSSGHPLNFLEVVATIVNPELETIEVTLKQVGAGQYQISRPATAPGTYLVRLGVNDNDQSLGQITLGLVVPYSPEYKITGIDHNLLTELARITGGSELLDLAQIWEHNLPSTAAAHEIWQALLLIAALLFPLDVAIRRVMFGVKDLQKARDWLFERLPVRQKELVEPPHLLGQLFQARDRSRHRQIMSHETNPPINPQTPSTSSADSSTTSMEQSPESHDSIKRQPHGRDQSLSEKNIDSDDPLARLREAKKRARRN